MNANDANKLIRERIPVTPQRVVLAKAIVLDASTKDCQSSCLVEAVLKANGVEMPKQIVLHPSVDPTSAITAAVEALCWQLAASEAIWSLFIQAFSSRCQRPRGRHHPFLGQRLCPEAEGIPAAGRLMISSFHCLAAFGVLRRLKE